MKIYSSDLLTGTEVDLGNLTITSGDALIVTDANNATYTTPANGGTQTANVAGTAGLIINDASGFDTTIVHTGSGQTTYADSSVHYYYLDARGVRKDLADLLPAQFNLVGSNLSLQNRAGNTVIDTITLPAGEGGGGASTNPSTYDLPVKSTNDVGTSIFQDSIISLGGKTEATQTSGMVNGAVSPSSSSVTINIDSITSGDQTEFHTRFSAGVTNTEVSIGGTIYTGTLTSTGGGATATLVLTSLDDNIGDDAAVTLPLAAESGSFNSVLIEGSGTTVTIEGDLVVSGDTITANVGELLVEDKYIVSNYNTGTTTVNGGLLVQKATATDANAGTGEGTHAGIRFNEAASGNGVWEVSQGTPSDHSTIADADWTAIALSESVHGKLVARISQATNQAQVNISTDFSGNAQTDSGVASGSTGTNTGVGFSNTSSGWVVTIALDGTNTNIATDDLVVTVYEVESNVGSQIIPESVAINDSTDDLIITLPQDYISTSGSDSKILKVVAIG